MCGCPSWPPSLPVPAEVKQTDLIASKEYEELSDVGAVARVQDIKFPEMVADSYNVLRAHGFGEEAKPIAGSQSGPSSVCLCYVVQNLNDSHLVTSTTDH